MEESAKHDERREMSAPGRFITLEGGEGAGKSTQARKLAAALEARGISCVVTREPGGSPGAEVIRKLLVQGDMDRWEPVAETLLLFAARSDHIARTIKPALAAGKWVICDRFTDSTYAYQGAGRNMDRETIRRIESISIDDFQPELTFILDIVPDEGLLRTNTRANPLFDPAMKNPDSAEAQSALNRRKEARFERFGKSFHVRLRQAFLEIARRHRDRCVLVDAGGSETQVADAILNAVRMRFDL
jgi:dTMP kinase